MNNNYFCGDGPTFTVPSWSTAPAVQEAGIPLYYGGSPEGAVNGEPGQKCTDIGSGDIYIKMSGSGNTGWTALP